MPNKHPLKVFISHAFADHEKAQKLYAHLLSLGVRPWLDTENLLPGQDWKYEIRKALDESDAILICFSKKSFNKWGDVQKEMRLGLEHALESPPGEVFLVPCRFEECDLPFSLREYQAVDLFTENGVRMLNKSLSARAQKVGASPPAVDNSPVPEIKKEKAVPRQWSDEKADSDISNILVGNDNEEAIDKLAGDSTTDAPLPPKRNKRK